MSFNTSVPMGDTEFNPSTEIGGTIGKLFGASNNSGILSTP